MRAADQDRDDKDCFYISYSTRDTLLYAAAVGFGNNNEASSSSRDGRTNDDPTKDLPYVWEGAVQDNAKPSPTVVPTWVTTWPFWATTTPPSNTAASSLSTTTSTSRLPQFPPPTMQQAQLIPPHCWVHNEADQTDCCLDDYPILHTAQHITWHSPASNQIPSQGTFRLQRQVVAVIPKAVGTFVTTQFDIFPQAPPTNHHQHTATTTPDQLVLPTVTLQSTALILGLEPARIRPWRAHESISVPPPMRRPSPPPRTTPQHYTITVAPNQALLYRLASGDTNAIHVNPQANPFSDDDDNNHKCVLHGLATLGMVTRVIVQQQQLVHHPSSYVWHSLQVAFAAPVHVGDTLDIAVTWPDDKDASPQIHFYVTVQSKQVLHGVITLWIVRPQSKL